ncbi:MAG: transposase [Bacteroidales bacterium]|nr:transposase [Bacteroidales bacterium]
MENTKRERRRRVRRRRFLEDEVHHIYQRTINRFNIFYDLEDYLVYYTIFSIAARQYEVTILGLCLMFDHIHMLIKSDARVRMSEFVRQVTCMFAREQNNEVGRKGSLFQARFGSAPKKGLKLLRTAIAYLFNNPVEKRLCSRAEEYRWNFLAYALSPHPFSDPLILGRASLSMKRAVKEVDLAESEDRHLRYVQLKRLLSKLDEREKMQLVDHIISIYKPFDYEEVIACYGSYEDMLTAINSNTGSEYDIKEDRYRFSDIEYIRMGEILHDAEGLKELRKVTGLEMDEKMRLFKVLSKHLSCDNLPIAKFLHIHLTKP